MSDAKIVITWNCNLDCSYCCNKYPDIKNSFKPITHRQIAESNYDSYQITGGEPIMPATHGLLERAMFSIPHGKPVYIYTNGLHLNPVIVPQFKLWNVKGINIGCHGQRIFREELRKINEQIPVRLWIQDTKYKSWMGRMGLDIRLWRMNDCYKSKAERFYLVENKR